MELSITEHRDFIKRQADFHARVSFRLRERIRVDPESPGAKRAAEKLPAMERLASSFAKIVDAVDEDVRRAAQAQLPTENNQAGFDPSILALLANPTTLSSKDIEGLPNELIAQLQISDADKFRWDVTSLIERTPNKQISIEVLLIALYRLQGRIYERVELSNRMYRLARKGLIYPVQGRKGWYTTEPQDGESGHLDLPEETED